MFLQAVGLSEPGGSYYKGGGRCCIDSGKPPLTCWSPVEGRCAAGGVQVCTNETSVKGGASAGEDHMSIVVVRRITSQVYAGAVWYD